MLRASGKFTLLRSKLMAVCGVLFGAVWDSWEEEEEMLGNKSKNELKLELLRSG